MYKQKRGDWVIQPSDLRINLTLLIVSYTIMKNSIRPGLKTEKSKNECVILIEENTQKLLSSLCN